MPEIEYIAQAQCRFVKPAGEDGLFTIGISLPAPQKTGEYGCLVNLPDSNEPRLIYGIDSLQSLSLAMRFAADRIDAMIAQGWKFYFGDTEEPFPFEAYFIPTAWTQKLEAIARQAAEKRPGKKSRPRKSP